MRVIVMLALAGCAADGDHTLDVKFDPCASHRLVAAPDTEASERTSIDDALALWSAVLPPAGITDESSPSEIPIRFELAAPAFRGIYLDESGEIVINRELVDTNVRAIAIAHELGHAFGLWHVERSERASVMNPGNITVDPTDADSEELIATWPSCRDQRRQSIREADALVQPIRR